MNRRHLAGHVYVAVKFNCGCGGNRFIHEGSEGGDGFSCWWNGQCEKCGKRWEMDSTTKVHHADSLKN